MSKTFSFLAILIALMTIANCLYAETTDIYIGNPDSTGSHAQRVINYVTRNALSQTLYFEDEMIVDGELKTGVITEFTYFYRKTSQNPIDHIQIRMYMTSTTLTAYTSVNGWIPYDEFTLVYEGIMDLEFTPVGSPFQKYTLVLDTPFEYTGGNFATMFVKLPPEGTVGATVQWNVGTVRPGARNLFATAATDWPDFPYVYPQSGSLANNGDVANTIITFYDGETGTLSGTVTIGSTSTPVADARVSIDGSTRFSMTNAQGLYTIPHIPIGTISVTATKYLHAPTTHSNIIISSGETTTQNIQMTAVEYDLNAISITGITHPVAQQAATNTIRVRNDSVQSSPTSYTVEIRQVGVSTPLASVPGVVIPSEGFHDFLITWTPSEQGNIEIYGHVVFSLDQNLENNSTDPFVVEVQPAGAIVSYAGDPYSEMYARENPIDHFYQNSLSQTVYLASELGGPGAISQMHLRIRAGGDVIEGTPVRIWLAHTEIDHFGTNLSWQPFADFIEVYEGILQTQDFGEKDILITFDNAFPYVGGNIIVMMTHSRDSTAGTAGNHWHQTSTPGENRHIRNTRSSPAYDPSVSYPSATRGARYANARFITLTDGLGKIVGTVTHEGDPVDNVLVQINERAMSTYTDDLGNFSFPFLLPGAVSLSFSKPTFQNAFIPYVEILAGEDTVINQVMTSIPNDLAGISITGPTTPTAGVQATYKITVSNVGFSAVEGDRYSVALMQIGNNTPLGTLPGETIEPLESIDFEINWTPDTPGNIVIYGNAVFEDDEDITNNLTPNLTIHIQRPGTESFYIGNETSASISVFSPFNHLWRNGLAQTIYVDSEIPAEGSIMGIVYRHNGTVMLPDTPVSIYLASIQQHNFPDLESFIPIELFSLAYNGPINAVQGPVDVYIPFDTPFPYTGGHIAVMTYKHHVPTLTSGIQWQITPTLNNQNVGQGFRTFYYYSDSVILDPALNPDLETFPTPGRAISFPNATILISTEAQGHIAGVVKNPSGNPVEGVRVSLVDLGRSTLTNAAGEYLFQYVFEGTVAINASRHGYYDTNIDVVVEEGITANGDLQLTPIPTVTVSGTVIGSDTGNPIANAEIWLRGYENYYTTTNASGAFTINNVYFQRTYSIEAYRIGYVRYFDDVIEVGNNNLVLPPIMLLERAYPVNNLLAVAGDTSATITWETPTGGLDAEVYHSFRNASVGGWSSLVSPYDTKTGIRFSAKMLDERGIAGAELTNVYYFLHTLTVPGIHTIRIYTGGYGELNSLSDRYEPGNLVHEQVVDISTVAPQIWIDVPLDVPVDIPIGEEMMIEVNVMFSTGFVLGRDDIPPVAIGFSDLVDYGEGWMAAGYTIQSNQMIRALARNAHGPIIIEPDFKTSVAAISDRHRTDGVPPSTVAAISDRHINRNTPSIQWQNVNAYLIYRTTIENLNDESSWDFLGTTNTLSYQDDSWGTLPFGAYRYIVKAAYPNDNLSRPVISNMIHTDMEGDLEINLISSNNVPLTNIFLRLEHSSGNPVHRYEYVGDNNQITIPKTWRGDYKLVVNTPGYLTHTDNSIYIYPDLGSINIEMMAIGTPSFVIAQEIAEEGVELNWDEPHPGFDISFSHSITPIRSGVGVVGGGILVAAHRYTPDQLRRLGVAGAELTKVTYIPWTIAPYHEIRVWINGTISPIDPGELVYFQELDPASLQAQTPRVVELGKPVTIPLDAELWIGVVIEHEDGSLPIGIDSTTSGLGYGNLIFFGGSWAVLSSVSNILGLWTLSGYAEGASGGYSFSNVMELPYEYNVELELLSGMIEPTEKTTLLTTINNETSTEKGVLYQATRRNITDYRIYRTLDENIDNDNLWTTIVETHSGLSYFDTTWLDADDGKFRYVVKAHLSENRLSSPAFSNLVEKITSELGDDLIPLTTSLKANYPNPFNPSTTIAFDIKDEGHVRIDIYNIRGQRVKTLLNENMKPGRYSSEWNGVDDNGRNVTSGIYFYRMTAVGFSETKRMVLMK